MQLVQNTYIVDHLRIYMFIFILVINKYNFYIEITILKHAHQSEPIKKKMLIPMHMGEWASVGAWQG